jgi:MFS transporter, FHS family, glucose/mannose:H+ symporter
MSLSKSASLLTAGGFLSFFVFGFIDNLKGPILPELLRAERLSYGQGGTLLLAVYFGFVIATLLTGIMADVVGNRGVLLFAGICLCLGLAVFGVANSFALWMLLLAVVGLGLGAIEVGANGLMVELHPNSRGRYLNLLATFHGAGSLLVPLYAAWLWPIRKKMSHSHVEQFRDTTSKEDATHEFGAFCHRLQFSSGE